MNARDAKRVDSLYRNLKQLPMMTVLGVLVPVLILILPPVGLAYWWLRRRLLANVDAGRIVVEPHDRKGSKRGRPSTAKQLEYIRHDGARQLIFVAVACAAVGSLLLGLIAYVAFDL
ncbi:hypothetical protein [Alienimonas californiensis]|uniref:Uncharacterized protein n=1 Tax=Alienimonas californiensis TaxID=2527989 RepID=A0A517P7T8_9PLAN|nr:hypothetical protein [Alienimonas californiensis]QDT15444.1 hypothetical protein CA12_15290 [Alienimonas californiensis]